MSAPTPGQALSPDPADFAYHVRATAFNVLTGKMAGDEWSVPRSERDAIARAVVDAVEPLIRADERAVAAQEPHAAPGTVVTAKALAAALALRPIKVRTGNGWETRRPVYPDALAADLLDTIKARSADVAAQEPQPAPELAGAMAALAKVVASHERVMYAAAIDIRHGQPGEARRLLAEELDGWDGPEWDGTETGAQYLERTREGR